MIQFAGDTTEQQVWDMWKTVFGDSDDYMQLYFKYKYRNENTLIYIEDDKAVSSLQMLSYKFTFCGEVIPVQYLSGVCTLPEYRGKGYARELLLKSFEVAIERGIPLVILVPQEDWLLSFYTKFGFALAFDSGTEQLPPLKKIIDDNQVDLYNAYKEFDSLFRNKDMAVQKSFQDFQAIAEEAALFNYPPKKNLRGMARIINSELLLDLFAAMYCDKAFTVSLKDEILKNNDSRFTVNQSIISKDSSIIIQPLLEFDIRDFTQAIMGYHTSEKAAPVNTLFPEKTPVMNYMLE
ncbi:MAG: GNAT family N-acetyltransferase [Fermentimonas sp.]|jgi:predicted acetyltransferase|nr:GNAT family N-acetyltransferase [Fermentimonas sp.]HBT85013.1 GNAT family N-acetyltransferase [Porphyromonadaceae bacterium]MDD2931231.1 GNAT family N-acetyltransferase [Fermentimonas sp.]MDD3188900.1 GNAT family N-acetyltransferase [Fermentimonas sp.]MDD3510852.1 GNAT family N-acetyltransferase [Fermentimonas sp.]